MRPYVGTYVAIILQFRPRDFDNQPAVQFRPLFYTSVPQQAEAKHPTPTNESYSSMPATSERIWAAAIVGAGAVDVRWPSGCRNREGVSPARDGVARGRLAPTVQDIGEGRCRTKL
jgi:hypothetical protein